MQFDRQHSIRCSQVMLEPQLLSVPPEICCWSSAAGKPISCDSIGACWGSSSERWRARVSITPQNVPSSSWMRLDISRWPSDCGSSRDVSRISGVRQMTWASSMASVRISSSLEG